MIRPPFTKRVDSLFSQTLHSSQLQSLYLLIAILLKGVAAAIAFIVPGCVPSPNQSSQNSTLSSQQPILRISVQPTQNRAEQERMIAPLQAHLEKVLGQQVDFLIAKNYKDAVDMLVDGRANVTYAGVVSYFQALERGVKVKPLVAPIDQYTVRPWYRSCFVVPADSSIKTLQDLKGKRVGFVDRSSTSGYLMPVVALKQQGIDPRRDFAEKVFGGNHTKTEALLAANRVDAIATNLATFNHWKQAGKLTAKNARIIWESAPIPHSPIQISQDLPPKLVEKLKEAFLTAPPGIKDLMGAETAGYTLVEAEDYESIRKLRRELKFAQESS